MRFQATMGTSGSIFGIRHHRLPTALSRLLMASMLMVGLAGVVGWGQTASAQDSGGPVAVDPTTCGHFETQEDATEALHSGELANPEFLDADGDGIACETRWPTDPNSPPPVYDPTSCGHFETQADAQAAFDSGDLPDPENLDADGDGIACERAFGVGNETSGEGESGGVVVLPSTGAGPAASASSGSLLVLFLAFLLVGAGGCALLRRGAPRSQR